MKDEHRKEFTRHMVRRAFAGDIDEQHPLDDEAFVFRLGQGSLDERERVQLRTHLSACQSCRDALADMIRLSLLELEETSEDLLATGSGAQVESTRREVSKPPGASRTRRLTTMGVGLALVLALIALFGIPRADTLDQCRNLFARGEYEKVVALAEESLAKDGSDETRPQLRELMEKSAYRSGRSKLSAGEFQDVKSLGSRCQAVGAESARLENLRLQADRKATDEVSIEGLPLLTDHGFSNKGVASQKALPRRNDEIQTLEREFGAASDRYGASVDLHLNHGFVLFEMGEYAQAQEQFAAVQQQAPTDGRIANALGLALFQQDKFPAALRWFRRAQSDARTRIEARFNEAVTLVRLGQDDQAAAIWRELRSDPSAKSIHSLID